MNSLLREHISVDHSIQIVTGRITAVSSENVPGRKEDQISQRAAGFEITAAILWGKTARLAAVRGRCAAVRSASRQLRRLFFFFFFSASNC
jgi:hypothetical protein